MLSGEYPPRAGGVGDYTAQLATALGRLGLAVTVLTSRGVGTGDPSKPPARREVPDWGFGCWRIVGRAIREWRADLVHIQYQAGAFQLKGAVNMLPFWLRRRCPNVATLTTFHDLRVPYVFPKAGPLRPLAIQTLLRSSQGAIFVDSADLARVGPGSKRRWVPVGSNIPCAPPPGYDRAITRRGLGAGHADVLIGYFGFLSAAKGAQTLVRAFRLLLDDDRPCRLVFIGAGVSSTSSRDLVDEKATISLAVELGLKDRISITGFLSPAEVSAQLLASDLIALPYEDGASFRRGSLLAAFEHARPVVTTTPSPAAAGFGSRILEPGRHFLAVPPNDPAALAKALARLVVDEQLAANLGREGRALAERCSWAAIAAETAELYAACLDARRSSRR